MKQKTSAIINSLKYAPLLIRDLPQAHVFNRSLLKKPDDDVLLEYDQKLGHFYEQALLAIINASPQLTYLANNLQIFDENKQTLGELDFILFDKTNEHHIHLELAVKFYMAVKKGSEWHFPGPNQTDNWRKKLNRLQTHQLCLTKRPEAKTLLRDHFDIKTIKTCQLIYGCLFHPIDCKDAPELKYMSSNARIGLWLYADEWQNYFDNSETFYFVPKPLWPIAFDKDTIQLLKPVSRGELIDSSKERCIMFIHSNTYKPYFLVPENWGKP